MSPCRLKRSAMRSVVVCTWLLLAWTVVTEVDGHGYMLVPPGRSSAWRVSLDYFHVNYNDNANYCGGRSTQHDINNGSCGLCGDDFRTSRPRDNERGGFYSTGNIVAQYASGGVLDVAVVITANHMGKFYFAIFPSNDPSEWEEESLFQPLYNADTGTTYYDVPDNTARTFSVKLKIPDDMVCSHCVLRWKYVAANSWGCNSPDDCCLGCGNQQEQFYSCADVIITRSGTDAIPQWIAPNKDSTGTPRTAATTTPSPTVPIAPEPTTTTPKPTTTTPKPTTTTRRPITTTRRPTTTTRRPTTTTRRPTTTTRRPTTTTPDPIPRTTTAKSTTTSTTTRAPANPTRGPANPTRAPANPTQTNKLPLACTIYCFAVCKPGNTSTFCYKELCEKCPGYKNMFNK
ncbi:platelet glycoprotein Ib alpha chain-like [Haliotis rufescens]|uniref:platelet glycoprotein Ib alpha chain-like n=1 Tax=Haliotis rufescens TaxID=6454 RepID=UPI00201E807E|nr:platelet glycoprotein Ib alpha chain-like [Haliotis rufescens]